MQKRILILALLLGGFAAAQVPNPVNPADYTCTADAIAAVKGSKNVALGEGTHPVALNWTASGGNVGWYRVYRGTASDGPYTMIADCVSGPSYTDTTAVNGSTYFYVVTAVGNGLESGNSNQAMAQTPPYDSVTIAASKQGFPVEVLSTLEAITRTQALTRTASETLTTGDSLVTQAAHSAVFSETLTTSAAMAATVARNPNNVNLYEDLTTTATPSRTAILGRAATETLGVSDAIAPSRYYGGFSSGISPEIYLMGSYAAAAAGSCGFDLALVGHNFTQTSIAQWNGSDRATTYVSSSTLRMTLLTADLASPGANIVTVMDTGGNVGRPRTFTVMPATATLSATYLLGSMLIADGTNFAPNSVVLWNGATLPTRWISFTRLQALLPAGVRAIGSNVVTVSETQCSQ